MLTVNEVCAHVRSKNAGPFWITIDLFFSSEEYYQHYKDSETLGPELFERLFCARREFVKRFAIDALRVVKISFARPRPQGWVHERDLHAGQQYVRLLDVELAPGPGVRATRSRGNGDAM